MKNKTKKILTTLGLGVVMGVSGLALTGCDTQLTQEQTDNIYKTVENFDSFMNKTTELIDTSNTNSNSNTDKIIDAIESSDENSSADINKLIEIIEDSHNKVSVDEAHRIFQYALTSIIVNKDNIWDNLKIDTTATGGFEEVGDSYTAQTYVYKMSDNKNVVVGSYKDQVETYAEFSETATVAVSNTFPRSVIDETRNKYGIFQYLATTTSDNISSCTINTNGEYKISLTLFDIENNTTTLIDVKISSDMKLLSSNIYFITMSSSATEMFSESTTFSYGALTDEIVQEKIDQYNQQQQEK